MAVLARHSHSDQHHRQRPPEISDGMVTLYQNLDRPKSNIKETAPLRDETGFADCLLLTRQLAAHSARFDVAIRLFPRPGDHLPGGFFYWSGGDRRSITSSNMAAISPVLNRDRDTVE
jgi:hypothetical protein